MGRMDDVLDKLPLWWIEQLYGYFEDPNFYKQFKKDLEEQSLCLADQDDDWQILFHNIEEVDEFKKVVWEEVGEYRATLCKEFKVEPEEEDDEDDDFVILKIPMKEWKDIKTKIFEHQYFKDLIVYYNQKFKSYEAAGDDYIDCIY